MRRNFSYALAWLRDGERVRRSVWDKNVYIELQAPSDTSETNLSFITMTKKDGYVIRWLPNAADLLLDDWTFYEEEEQD